MEYSKLCASIKIECWHDAKFVVIGGIGGCLMRDFIILTLSSLVGREVVVITTPGTTSDNKVGVNVTFCFRWRSKYVSLTKILGLYSLRRHGLIGMGILIINLRRSSDGLMFIMGFLYPSDNEVVEGILVSLAPSVRPSVRPSARPSRIRCSLCSTYSSGWIHFILIHLIEQLQEVRRVQNFCKI